jgi:hypothetical protein
VTDAPQQSGESDSHLKSPEVERAAPVLEYGTNKQPTGKSLRLPAVLTLVTLLTTTLQIWFNYADVLLLPAYIGSIMMVIGVVPLWKERQGAARFVFVGAGLLLIDLACIVVMLTSYLWRNPYQIVKMDPTEWGLLLGFVADIAVVILLARQLKQGRPIRQSDMVD